MERALRLHHLGLQQNFDVAFFRFEEETPR
jgi:hypothetical protein